MGLVNIIMKAIGFEGEEKQKPLKTKVKKEKQETPAIKPAQFNLSQKEEPVFGEVQEEEPQISDVKVFYPKTQKEVQQIIGKLKNKEPVMINLSNLLSEDRIRALDFLSGAIYVLNGKTQKVEGNLYFFAPEGIEPMEFEIKR